MAKEKTKRRGFPSNPALDASKQKEFNQKILEAKEKTPVGKSIPGVVYVSRLPWGFDEEPMRSFFSQFGTINKLRVSRSKKTGNSRGYAYIQFAHDEVAKIVAETMNNYLMFEKLIKCKHLSTVHPDTFKNADRKFRPFTSQEKAIKRHNLPKTAAGIKRNLTTVQNKLRKKQSKLAELGIDYELEITGSGPCRDKKKKEMIKVKEEIFSDDETLANKTGKQKRKRKTESASGSDIKTMSPSKARKTDLETDKADVIHVSDEESAVKRKKVTAKGGKQRTVSDSLSGDEPKHSSVAKRTSPKQQVLSKTRGKK